jgi:hypothetical protein
MTPAAQIRQAAADVRCRRRAVPGFSDAVARLLEACAGLPETRGLALKVAHDIRPRKRTANRTERNEQ